MQSTEAVCSMVGWCLCACCQTSPASSLPCWSQPTRLYRQAPISALIFISFSQACHGLSLKLLAGVSLTWQAQ